MVSESLRDRLMMLENAGESDLTGLARRFRVRTVGCVKEIDDPRVALTAPTVEMLTRMSLRVLVESGAGEKSHITDDHYRTAGAHIFSREQVLEEADVLLQIKPVLSTSEGNMPEETSPDGMTEVTNALTGALRPNTVFISLLQPAHNPTIVAELREKGVLSFALDQVPKIPSAAAFDASASLAQIAGYRAVVEASQHFGRFLGGQITAAGRIPPAIILVLGAGIAGLAAVETAKKMGAIVRCFDTRPHCRSAVTALGAEFLDLKEQSGRNQQEQAAAYVAAEEALLEAQMEQVDILITTAVVPGRSPKLISRDMVASMRMGCVTVDLAAGDGGNIETTVKDAAYLTPNGVTCVGYTDLTTRIPAQASQAYARNITKFLQHLMPTPVTPTAEGRDLVVDFADLVTRASVVTCENSVLWPAPRHLFPPPQAPTPTMTEGEYHVDPAMVRRQTFGRAVVVAVALCGLLALNLVTADMDLITLLIVLALSGVVSYQAGWTVRSMLHTPLLYLTTALAGLGAVGAVLLLARRHATLVPNSMASGLQNQLTYGQDPAPKTPILKSARGNSPTVLLLAAVALGASCINLATGFAVCKRLVGLLERSAAEPHSSARDYQSALGTNNANPSAVSSYNPSAPSVNNPSAPSVNNPSAPSVNNPSSGAHSMMTSAPPEFGPAAEPYGYECWYVIAGAVAATLYLAATVLFATDISELAFLAAALCCVMAVASFAHLKTARAGCALALAGVLLGCVAALGVALLPLARHRHRSWELLFKTTSGPTLVAVSAAAAVTVLGCVLGAALGNAVSAAELPQTLALCQMLVGIAGATASCGYFYKYAPLDAVLPYNANYNGVKAFCVVMGAGLGSVTAAGALMAGLKLHGLSRAVPIHLPGRNSITLVAIICQVVVCVLFTLPPGATGVVYSHLLYYSLAIGAFLGVHVVAGLHTKDMAVCLALLSSIAGWTLVAEGFVLDNLLLTIVGCLVGVAGALQVRVLGQAANKSLSTVLLTNYKPGTTGKAYSSQGKAASEAGLDRRLLDKTVGRPMPVDLLADTLLEATSVVIVPGYGLSVTQAQWALTAVVLALQKREVDVRVALHPIAGRLPGHMHVILAEAGIPTNIVSSIEVEGPHDVNQDVNKLFADADVALVVGAYDITNSAAEEDPTCTIAGMPVLQVWKAKTCVYLRNSANLGMNPVYAKDNVSVLYGDPRQSLEALNIQIQSHSLV